MLKINADITFTYIYAIISITEFMSVQLQMKSKITIFGIFLPKRNLYNSPEYGDDYVHHLVEGLVPHGCT